MKRTFALFLAICIVFALVGCNSAPKVSDVTVDKLIEAVKTFSNDVSSKTKATDNGYIVSIECGNYMSINAITDKDKHMFSVEMIQTNADVDYYSSFTGVDVASDILNWQDVPMGKVLCSLFVFRIASDIIPTLTGDEGTVDFILSTRGTAQKIGNWEFSSTISEEDSVVITAAYAG